VKDVVEHLPAFVDVIVLYKEDSYARLVAEMDVATV
jgi:hypothetical protein